MAMQGANDRASVGMHIADRWAAVSFHDALHVRSACALSAGDLRDALLSQMMAT